MSTEEGFVRLGRRPGRIQGYAQNLQNVFLQGYRSIMVIRLYNNNYYTCRLCLVVRKWGWEPGEEMGGEPGEEMGWKSDN